MPSKAGAKPAAATKTAAAKKAAAAKTASAATKKRKVDDEPDAGIRDESPQPKKSKTEPLKEASTNGSTKPKAATKPKAEAKPKAKAPAKSKTTKTKAPRPAPVLSKDEEEEEKPANKAVPAPKATKKVAAKKAPVSDIGAKINEAPTTKLDIYVFGEGSSGELGLGSRRVDGKKPIDVKRPRLNQNLSAKTVGVVQIACGGMHVAALTHDNRILTWGVNDQGALGRDTNWDGGLRDMDKEDDSDDEDEDDSGINPLESTPTAVDSKHFAEGTKFVQVVAGDSATFALTEDGRVYGWGTFRSSDGILGFTEKIKIQATPMLMPDLKNIKALAAGSNHILALDAKGAVCAWGAGQQNQLGRRVIERNRMSSLVPQGLGFPKKNPVTHIACGSYHSFALDSKGNVWAWGLNNFGETGIRSGAGDDEAAILKPTVVEALKDFDIRDIAGGEHHSLACAEDGTLLTWGRVDGHQVGIEWDDLTEDNTIYDERGNARILFLPTANEDVKNVISVAAGTDNNFAITGDGQVYSWGFSGNFQTGQGTTEDIDTPTLIDNSAIRGKKIVAAGAGGQFSVLIGIPDEPMTNGVH